MKESELEKLCNNYITELCQSNSSIFHQKVKAGGQRHSVGKQCFFKKSTMPGFPDMLLCAKGKYIGIEFKTPVGRQSDVQKICESKILAAGGEYYIIRTYQAFITLIMAIITRTP